MVCPFCRQEWKTRDQVSKGKPIKCPRCWRQLPGNRGVVRGVDEGIAGGVEGGAGERGRDGAAVSVVRKAKGGKKQLHPVPKVRGKLAGGGDALSELPEYGSAGSAYEKCPHGKLNAAYCRAIGGGC